jgi:hypothetical protein
MINVRHSFFSTKPSLRVAIRLALLVTAALFLSFAVIQRLPFKYSTAGISTVNASATRRPAPQHSDKPHVLAAAYYSINDNLTPTLMLINQRPSPMEIKPTLFDLNGRRFDAPAFTIKGASGRSINVDEWIALAGASFREGRLQVFYQGDDLDLRGVLSLVDTDRSLIFEQEFDEPLKDFLSSRLEGVWWLPSSKSEAKLAVSNTTGQPISVTIDVGQSKVDRKLQSLSLGPNETRVVVLDDSSNHSGNDLNNAQRNRSKLSRYGGISVNHTGAPGAMIACGFVQDISAGYSSIIQFSDPQKAKSSRLDGAGLRIGEIAGEELKQIAVIRNVGDGVNKVTVRIPYTLENGNKGEARLPEINLQPGETRMLNLDKFIERETHRKSVATAGLELEYTGAPGSITAMANSYTTSLNQVFRLIFKDAKSQASSTGEYLWSLEDNSSSIIYIKNVSDKPQHFALYIFYAEGNYVPGLRTVDPSQTMKFNIRELRDNRVPDINGNTIPLNIAGGTAHWSITGSGGPDKLLTGRIEQSSPLKGLSMTAACESCCPDSYNGSYVDPSNFTINIGETQGVTCYSRYKKCSGNGEELPPVIDTPTGGNVSNPSVADFDSFGDIEVRGLSPGSCDIQLFFTGGEVYTPSGDGECSHEPFLDPTAFIFVQVRTPDFTIAHDKSNTGLRPSGIIAGVNGADPPIPTADTQATVTVSTNPPTSGQNVTLSVVATEEGEFDAGGHVSHAGVRPVGTLSRSSGTTDQNGQFTATYTAPVFGGGHMIRATMYGVTKEVGIGVFIDGLSLLGAGDDYDLVGETTTHPINHFGTATAIANLPLIASDYLAMFPGSAKLRLNDMSVSQGGKFEIAGDWGNGSHAEHRVGRNCDIGSSNVPTNRWAALNQIFFNNNVISVNDETASANHWHVRF